MSSTDYTSYLNEVKASFTRRGIVGADTPCAIEILGDLESIYKAVHPDSKGLYSDNPLVGSTFPMGSVRRSMFREYIQFRRDTHSGAAVSKLSDKESIVTYGTDSFGYDLWFDPALDVIVNRGLAGLRTEEAAEDGGEVPVELAPPKETKHLLTEPISVDPTGFDVWAEESRDSGLRELLTNPVGTDTLGFDLWADKVELATFGTDAEGFDLWANDEVKVEPLLTEWFGTDSQGFDTWVGEEPPPFIPEVVFSDTDFTPESVVAPSPVPSMPTPPNPSSEYVGPWENNKDIDDVLVSSLYSIFRHARKLLV